MRLLEIRLLHDPVPNAVMVVPVVVNSAIRSGFRRYVMSIQYHGSSFLGFSLQHANAENCVLPNGTDVRGYVSVERRVRLALSAMLSDTCSVKNVYSNTETASDDRYYENLQVSSRTDRGVHAIKNTFHVDIRVNNDTGDNSFQSEKITVLDDHEIDGRRRRKHLFQSTERMLRSLNFFLRRTNPTSPTNGLDDETTCENNGDGVYIHDPMFETMGYSTNKNTIKPIRRRNDDTQYYCGGEWVRRCPAEEVRILAIKEAPLYMQNSTVGYEVYHQEKIVDWNVRYSAKSRTYIYRIMYSQNESYWGIPFEWDRSWRIYDNNTNTQFQCSSINIHDMRLAASYLIGTHDFSSFRATGCQRQSPIMTILDVTIHIEPYDTQLFGSHPTTTSTPSSLVAIQRETINGKCYIITIRYVGDAFLYRQVRKMTACLVAVGRGKIAPLTLRDMLLQRDPSGAPQTAPPQGLYLVNVEHEGIQI